MRLKQYIRKSYLKFRTHFHTEDCDCKMCIKESLIGRCGMGDRMNNDYQKNRFTYLVNRFVLFPPFNLWVWFGNRKWFGYTMFQRNQSLNKLKEKLNVSMLKTKEKFPHFFDE